MYLVTGGAGFIGSHLVEALVARGAQVRILDNFSSGRWENLNSVRAAVKVIEGDVADLSTARRASAGVDYILHHAAVTSVEAALQNPIEMRRTNIDGTLSMLLAARAARVKRFVFASSASVYGHASDLPTDENSPLCALSLYAASKVAGEAFAKSFSSSFSLPIVILRYFNVYGPRQDPASPYASVIIKFIDRLEHGQAPVILGDGTQTRDFIYVKDVVQADLLACSCSAAIGQVFNIASGQQTSILELAEMLNVLTGLQLEPQFAPRRPGEVYRSQANISRSKQILNWQPETDMETALGTLVYKSVPVLT